VAGRGVASLFFSPLHASGYRYAIAWYSKEQRDFVYAATPDTDAKLEAIAWIALPR